MGQATSAPNSLSFFRKNPITNEFEDISNKFAKATLTTLVLPVIVVAYPALNAYDFRDSDMTGFKVVDGAIGGLLGVIGWPLAPFMAIWCALSINFKEGPSLPLPISHEVLHKAEQEIKINTSLFYNIAIVGCSGTGKSSIVNSIRGYKDTHRKASRVGEIETTAGPMPYPHPDLAAMMIWDMPGVGTRSHPRETYFEDNFLCVFDLLVIVVGNRLMQDDIDIALKAKEHRIPVLFVRSKSDQAIQSKTKRHEGDSQYEWANAVGELVLEVKDSVFTQLRQRQLNTKKLFIVSAETLRMFVSTINKQEERELLKLIDEERFLTALIEGVMTKRRYLEKKAKTEEKRKRKEESNKKKHGPGSQQALSNSSVSSSPLPN